MKRQKTSNFSGKRVREYYQIEKEGNSKCRVSLTICGEVEEIILIPKII